LTLKIAHRHDTTHTVRSRDAALRRLSHLNRWLIAASAVLTGVLTDVAANAFPGHTRHAAATRRSSAARRRHHVAHKPLAPPAQAPQPRSASTPEPSAPAEAQKPAEETQPAPEQTPTPSSEPDAPAESREAAPAPEEAPAPEPVEPVVSGAS
jgi:outer membrane biosynthesis protein TonB